MLALAALPGALFLADTQPARGQATAIPVIQMQHVELRRALANLARQAGGNIILDPKLSEPSVGADSKRVPESLVTIRWENLTAEQALARLLAEHGLHAVESPVTSVTRITFTNQTATAVDKTWVAGGTNAAIPLIQMESMPLDKALANLVAHAQLQVVIDPKLSHPPSAPGRPPAQPPMVSIRWEKLTARQAIGALCENYGLEMVKDDATGGIRITPRP